MAAEHLPFELISRPPADPAAHRAQDKRALLARRQLPHFLSSHQQAALRYQPSPELLLALNMALHTGSPLLLTGEPGTGKTQAADFVGAYFGIPVYKFLVKSTSTAQDLLYEFDAVGYLRWAQSRGPQSPAENVARAEKAPPALDAIAVEAEAVRQQFLHKRALWHAYDTNGDAVVLIAEIDKAPRDFPNDLLHELDQHSFPHPFDQTRMIRPVSGRPPIVLVTSNEERRLPDAFLRRCIFHRIELTRSLVEAAVESMPVLTVTTAAQHSRTSTRRHAPRPDNASGTSAISRRSTRNPPLLSCSPGCVFSVPSAWTLRLSGIRRSVPCRVSGH
jgi:MoxR-like ATPase